MREEASGADDLLRHPGARLGNLALHHGAHSRARTRGSGVGLRATHERRVSLSSVVDDGHPQREPGGPALRAIGAMPGKRVPHTFDAGDNPCSQDDARAGCSSHGVDRFVGGPATKFCEVRRDVRVPQATSITESMGRGGPEPASDWGCSVTRFTAGA